MMHAMPAMYPKYKRSCSANLTQNVDRPRKHYAHDAFIKQTAIIHDSHTNVIINDCRAAERVSH